MDFPWKETDINSMAEEMQGDQFPTRGIRNMNSHHRRRTQRSRFGFFMYANPPKNDLQGRGSSFQWRGVQICPWDRSGFVVLRPLTK